jgi:hypothetical protein
VAEILEALNDANKILRRARLECSSNASTLPYLFVLHGADYLAAQADQLLQPIFEKET